MAQYPILWMYLAKQIIFAQKRMKLAIVLSFMMKKKITMSPFSPSRIIILVLTKKDWEIGSQPIGSI
jgi:hypothetical protein